MHVSHCDQFYKTIAQKILTTKSYLFPDLRILVLEKNAQRKIRTTGSTLIYSTYANSPIYHLHSGNWVIWGLGVA